MEMNLKNKEWREFDFKEIFPEIQRGKRLRKADHKKGNVPYVSSTAANNGVDNYVGNEEGVRIFSNCLSLANSGSVGACFYQPFEFVASDHVTRLENPDFNKYIYLFLASVVSRISEKYSFNREINDTRIKKEKILLPINEKSEPDFDFMEAFIKLKEQEKNQAYYNFINKRVKSLKKSKAVEPLSEKEFGEFRLQDLFDTKKGNQNKMTDLKNGDFPLISAKNGNNGLKDFVTKNHKETYPKESLTLNNDGDGGAGISYYQAFDYLLDSHVTSLQPKVKLNKHTLLFISRCITKQRNKFGHGYSLTNNRLTAFKIMLPINSSQEPDYLYMENYMKRLEYKKLKSYLNKKIKNTSYN